MSCLHFLICPEDFIVSRSLSESLEIVWRFAEIQSKTAGRSAYDASFWKALSKFSQNSRLIARE